MALGEILYTSQIASDQRLIHTLHVLGLNIFFSMLTQHLVDDSLNIISTSDSIC